MINSSTVIDISWLQSASLADLKAVMKLGGQKLNEVNALLSTPEGAKIASDMLNDPDYIPVSQRQPTPEEAEQIAVDKQRAEEQAAEAEKERLEKEAQDKAAAEAAATAAVVEASKPPVKKVLQYQVTDEATGKPIGRPTHIEYTTEEELIEKMRAAHVNAVRYADRIKRGRVQSVETNSQKEAFEINLQKERDEATAEVEAAAKANDAAKMAEAIRRINKIERQAEQGLQKYREEGRAVAGRWMADHKDDYVPCDANSELIQNWLNANGPVVDGQKKPLPFTYDNLELAYAATESQLVKPSKSAPVEEAPASVVDNPPAAAPVAQATVSPSITAPAAPVAVTALTPVAQSSTPVATAPESTPAAAQNAQPAARRPGVNGSLPPGELSAQRPSVNEQPKTSTRAELMKELKIMPNHELRRKLKDANYVKKLEAAGIPVLSLR